MHTFIRSYCSAQNSVAGYIHIKLRQYALSAGALGGGLGPVEVTARGPETAALHLGARASDGDGTGNALGNVGDLCCNVTGYDGSGAAQHFSRHCLNRTGVNRRRDITNGGTHQAIDRPAIRKKQPLDPMPQKSGLSCEIMFPLQRCADAGHPRLC